MKFMVLSYADQTAFQALPQKEREAAIDKWIVANEELRSSGHYVGGQKLKNPSEAVTIRSRGGKVDVTDGPFTETKEQLGGALIIDAKDLNQAIALMSNHPGVQFGTFEIRPIDEDFMKMLEVRAATLAAK